MNISSTYCGDHFPTDKPIRSACRTPKTSTVLQVNHLSVFLRLRLGKRVTHIIDVTSFIWEQDRTRDRPIPDVGLWGRRLLCSGWVSMSFSAPAHCPARGNLLNRNQRPLPTSCCLTTEFNQGTFGARGPGPDKQLLFSLHFLQPRPPSPSAIEFLFFPLEIP